MARLPYFGRTTALDDAREMIKEQTKRNTVRDTATTRMATQMAGWESEAVRAGNKERQIGDQRLTTARKYDAAGIIAPSNVAGRPVAVTPTKAAQEFQRGLRESGVNNPYALSAIMGHGQIESGFNPNIPGDNGTSWGILQWRDEPNGDQRQTRARNWIKQNGGKEEDPYMQGRYAGHEMKTTEKRAGDMILNAKSVDEASKGMLAFERMQNWDKGHAGAIGGPARLGASNAWFKTITSTKPEEVAGNPNGLETYTKSDGTVTHGFWARNSDLATVFANSPKTARATKPVMERGVDAKGRTFWEYTGTTPNAAPSTAVPPGPAGPPTMQPAPVPVDPQQTAAIPVAAPPVEEEEVPPVVNPYEEVDPWAGT